MHAFELHHRAQPATACPVRVGAGALDRLVEDLAERPPASRFVVVSDSNVAPLHGAPLRDRLRARGLSADLLSFPAGEASKTRETKRRLEDALFELGAGRDTALLAVGGGVTGDLAGFVAATWHRGVPVVQVPTSLLAMADAALGGKTAVDLPGGKNLVGAFHRPCAVYADVEVLGTLPGAELVSGFAEVVKAGAIADVKLFRWLEGAARSLLRREAQALEQAVTWCLRIKGRVVVRDEREGGRRAILNFGHTVGHAIEAVSRYGVAHGRAVAVGMMIEGRLAVGRTGFPPRHLERLERLLAAFGLSTSWPAGLSPEEVAAATNRDKKSRAGEARYALPVRLGRMLSGDDVTVPIEPADLCRAIDEAARAELRGSA